jgi:hypothetical protein
MPSEKLIKLWIQQAQHGNLLIQKRLEELKIDFDLPLIELSESAMRVVSPTQSNRKLGRRGKQEAVRNIK